LLRSAFGGRQPEVLDCIERQAHRRAVREEMKRIMYQWQVVGFKRVEHGHTQSVIIYLSFKFLCWLPFLSSMPSISLSCLFFFVFGIVVSFVYVTLRFRQLPSFLMINPTFFL
jgi:hypothetical protein